MTELRVVVEFGPLTVVVTEAEFGAVVVSWIGLVTES